MRCGYYGSTVVFIVSGWGRDVSKLKSPFWLDGGYDRDEVEACIYHPDHRWHVFEVGEAVKHPYRADERMVICRGCFVPRCGHTTEENPCMLPRHHPELHLYADGTVEDDSVWPGNLKPLPPDIPIRGPGAGGR